MPPHFQVLEDNLRVGQGLVCLFGIEFLVWSGLVFFFFFRGRVSLCIPDCLGIHSVDQAGHELIEIHLPLSPEC